MRKLLYFSILHSSVDLGSVSDQVSAYGNVFYGKRDWSSHLKGVLDSWDEIDDYINRHIFDISYVRLYQDSLPSVDSIGMTTIKDIANRGSKNYQILDRLISQGAHIEAAEDKELLFEEHSHIKSILSLKTKSDQFLAYSNYMAAYNGLLKKRDSHISHIINTTLRDKETGIAFFGASHCILDKLESDIIVTNIDIFDKISELKK